MTPEGRPRGTFKYMQRELLKMLARVSEDTQRSFSRAPSREIDEILKTINELLKEINDILK